VGAAQVLPDPDLSLVKPLANVALEPLLFLVAQFEVSPRVGVTIELTAAQQALAAACHVFDHEVAVLRLCKENKKQMQAANV
jgi:hypothetical protein